MDPILDKFDGYIGIEQTLDTSNQLLRRLVQDLRPAIVGALRITCSDESEQECIESFQRHFVQPLLPTMKFWSKSPFRLANLGARYQSGAVQIAEDHFALPDSQQSFKVLLVKANSHVSVETSAEGYVYGQMKRYESESVYCGALNALLGGSTQGFAEDLRRDFGRGGVDRLRMIQNHSRADSTETALVAAIVNARLQSDRVVEEIEDLTPRTPTLFMVVAAVTLNKKAHDGELLCGVHVVDRRTDQTGSAYRGLSSRPPFHIENQGQLRVVQQPASP